MTWRLDVFADYMESCISASAELKRVIVVLLAVGSARQKSALTAWMNAPDAMTGDALWTFALIVSEVDTDPRADVVPLLGFVRVSFVSILLVCLV